MKPKYITIDDEDDDLNRMVIKSESIDYIAIDTSTPRVLTLYLRGNKVDIRLQTSDGCRKLFQQIRAYLLNDNELNDNEDEEREI